jgi:signal peptidase I
MRAVLVVEFLPDVLARDGSAWVTSVSWSMAPLIRPGDALRVVPVGADSVRAGAIVVYRAGVQLIVHRVVAQTHEGIVTRGDALHDADAGVSWPQVVGRVTAIRTPRGRTLELDRSPWTVLEPVLGWLARRRRNGRLAWKAGRAPFHVAAALLR